MPRLTLGEIMFSNTNDLARLARDCGNHFFNRDALRFFDSRICRDIYGGRYFVTSEKHTNAFLGVDEPRRYTVREFDYRDGTLTIDTVGDFQGFDSLASAQVAARILAGIPNRDTAALERTRAIIVKAVENIAAGISSGERVHFLQAQLAAVENELQKRAA